MTVPTRVNQDARIADCWLGTDDTVTKDDKELFGLDKKQPSSVVLIPGLKVDVHQTSDGQGRVMRA
jgi:hypothetical protein